MSSFLQTLVSNFNICFGQSCLNPNDSHNLTSVLINHKNKEDDLFLPLETHSSPKIMNFNLNLLNIIKVNNESLSPKFNEEISEENIKKQLHTYKESKILDKHSSLFSDFTFNNYKDNCGNINNNSMNLESKNSSKIHNLYLYPNNIILDHEIKNAKKLSLSDETGHFLFRKELIINAAGLTYGLRNKRDGYTFFGNKEKGGDKIVNDFIANHKIEGDFPHSLFYIVFRRKSQKYYIKTKDIMPNKENNNMIYVEINTKFEIKKQKFFFIGDTLFSVETSLNEKINKVTIEFFSKTFQKKYEYTESNSPITIGRKGCIINMNSLIYSKFQCTVFFESNTWHIIDGYDKKQSLNGTWLLLGKKHEICNSTRMKIGTNVIKIEISE